MDLVSMRMILRTADDHELAGLIDEVDELMPVTLPILRAVFKTEFPKWESFKNKSGKSECFLSPKIDPQLTSFHQQSTTNSPPKNHVQPPVFAKTPSKNKVPPPPKKNTAKSPTSGRVWPVWEFSG